MSGRVRWSEAAIARLRRLAKTLTADQIAAVMGSTRTAIENAASRNGIAIKPRRAARASSAMDAFLRRSA
jgi:hypothetical protein